jgi:hypothetical protein
MQSSCCLWVREFPTHNNFWMPESIFMKFVMCIMASEIISTTWFINLFPLVPMPVCVPQLLLLCKRLVRCIPPSLLSKGSVNTFLWHRIHTSMKEVLGAYSWLSHGFLDQNTVKTFQREPIVGNAVFYEVPVLLKEIKQLVCLRTSCVSFNIQSSTRKL